jgi:hypothetical protein
MSNQRTDYLLSRYREYAEFQFATDGEGIGLRAARQDLADHASYAQEVFDLDELVVEAAQVSDYINPLLLDDQRSHPLVEWWWHLGKLRDGTYPAQLLPDHLRAIYQPEPERLAA